MKTAVVSCELSLIWVHKIKQDDVTNGYTIIIVLYLHASHICIYCDEIQLDGGILLL